MFIRRLQNSARRLSNLRGLFALLLSLNLALTIFAQHSLYVSDGEQAFRLVRKVDNRAPYILDKGKFVLPAPDDNATGNVPRRYKLQPADEFLPAFTAVRIVKAEFTRQSQNSVRRLDLLFQFTAVFSTNYRLSDVFFVIEFKTDDVQRKCFVQEVPAKDLQQARAISIQVPLPNPGTEENYELHVFSGGLEVFHSAMPRPLVEQALRKMVAKRIKDVRDAAPKPLTGPIPRYPESLASTKGKGQATISCVIAADGKPQNVKVKSASDPVFGDAAVTAMAEWWFVPKVVDGKPIDSAADLPFEFTPPASKKS